jgi:hypothetical protein
MYRRADSPADALFNPRSIRFFSSLNQKSCCEQDFSFAPDSM